MNRCKCYIHVRQFYIHIVRCTEVSWYTIDLNCNEYFVIVTQNTVVVFLASSGSKANHFINGLVESGRQSDHYNLNLAQITAQPLGTLPAAKCLPCCLSF